MSVAVPNTLRSPLRHPRWWLVLASALAMASQAAGCGDEERYPPGPTDGPYDEACRFDPWHCGDGVGALCDTDADCWDGFCCTEQANCAGGMCTLSCDRDDDCPSFMACEHHMCFFRCDDDRDCADGQSCEHNNTICEWP